MMIRNTLKSLDSSASLCYLQTLPLLVNHIYLIRYYLQIRVNGPDTAPLYKFLKEKKSGFLGSRIKWNFTKFLVDKEGHVLQRYSPTTSPFSIEVISPSLFLSMSLLCSFHSNFDISTGLKYYGPHHLYDYHLNLRCKEWTLSFFKAKDVNI